jgi:hypothetical protein
MVKKYKSMLKKYLKNKGITTPKQFIEAIKKSGTQ